MDWVLHGSGTPMSEVFEFHVLLVEDDPELASMVADYLSQHGFVVDTESRGDQAIERICNESFDALLLDVNLPGKDDLPRPERQLYTDARAR